MEFLVTARTRKEWSSTHGEEAVKWMKEGIRQFQNESRTKALYGFAGEDAGFLICEVQSADELNQYLTLNPVSAFTDFEVVPLVRGEEVISTLDKLEQHMKAA